MRGLASWLGAVALFVPVVASALPPATFAPKVDYAVGTSAAAAAIGDLNGDGTPDLVVANYGPASNSISVLLGTGGGAFGAKTDYAVGTNPISVAIGNLNGDSWPDLVVANWSSAGVSVLLGTGGGTFAPQVFYGTGSGRPISGKLALINADANLDLVVADWSANSIKVMLGNGAGGLGTPVSYPAGSLPYSIALADLNSDGRQDVVAANRGGTSASVLLGTGVGAFGAPTILAVGSDPISVALGLLNGDGILDLVVANQGGGTVSVLFGNGAGGFGPKTDYACGTAPLSVTIADVDQDTWLDLVVADYPSNVVSVLSGSSAGLFAPKIDFATGAGPGRLAIADLNGDLKKDLVVPNAVSATVSVLLNTNAGSSGVPFPANSTCPSAIPLGMGGSCCFDVIVRDALNNPVAGATVSFDFINCPVVFCPVPQHGPGDSSPASAPPVVTDANGLAHCCLCVAEDLPGPCNIYISANNILLCSVPGGACSTPAPPDTCTTEGWHVVAGSGPDPRWETAMVAKESNGELLLFGGFGGSPVLPTDLGDTWLWDGIEWNALVGSGPPARSGHAMAYDRVSGKVVLFGGIAAGVPLGDTWVRNGDDWGWVHASSTGPSPRSGHVMAYDENLKRVVLFGGLDANGTRNDLWIWEAGNWVSPAVAPGPGARTRAAMACDPIRKRLVLYGGSSNNTAAGALADTWEFDGTAWTRVARPVWDGAGFVPTFVTAPPARWRHAMTFGASCGRMILTGGETASGQFTNTTWSWDGSNWREGVPGLQTKSPAMAYDIARGKVTVFGGSLAFAMSAETSQLCTPCDDEAAPLDSLGNVIFPPTLDLSSPIVYGEVDEDRGDVDDLFPNFHTSADSWLKDFPCATSIGGEIPEEALNPALDDSLLALGINASAQTIADSLSSWEKQLLALFQTDIDSLPLAPPIDNGPYLLPETPWCPPDSGLYVFGGRDIVFVHGLQLSHVFKKLLFTPGALVDWKPPGGGLHGYELNPQFYDVGGFYRDIADSNWAPHIEKFFNERGIKNRYMIVAYPCNDRLEIAIQAMLTQINDAMRYGRNVKNPTGPDTTNFGTPSFVVVSHSTGGLLTDAAMHAAQTDGNLNAGFIAERCKAHVGLASATSGSQLATTALAVAGAISYATSNNVPWLCPLFNAMLPAFDVDSPPGCPLLAAVTLRSVLVDLVPLYTKARWGEAIENAGIRTVNLSGGNSRLIPVLKHIIAPGFDDGVLTSNSAAPNPGISLLWPSGFIAQGGPVGMVQTFDMGMAKQSKARAVEYYIDQAYDRTLNPATLILPYYLAGGPLTYLSPTGMLQSVGWEFTGTGFDPMRRYANHYSFMSCAADHFNIRSAAWYPDYFPHIAYGTGIMHANYEEARTIREEDEPALNQHYDTMGLFHYPNDDQPLLTPECTPKVHHFVKGRDVHFKIKILNKTFEKHWWIWKRNYMQPAGIGGLHVCDYMYNSILKCESPLGVCASSNVFAVDSKDWLQDAFPANETAGLPGTVWFDTTAAHIKTGRNTAQLSGNEYRFDVPGDSLVVCACDPATRLDLVFRILPGPGNYKVTAGRTNPPVPGMQLLRVPSSQLGVVTSGDASFWGQYIASNGQFGSPAGHSTGAWDPNVWNSARMDTAETNFFPVASRGNLPEINSCKWSATYHESDPKYATLGIVKFRCFLGDTLGPIASSNITCSFVPPWVFALPANQSGYNGTPTTKEYTKIIPDGLLTPGSHVQYFIRKSKLATPATFNMLPDTTRVAPQPGEASVACDASSVESPADDGHRWQQFGVLPDRWKDPAFGGAGMACMLYVDLNDGHGDERAWTTAAGLLGATSVTKRGSHNGWHSPTIGAAPDDPTHFVRDHRGQAGTTWDKYDVRGVDDGTNGQAGSLGSRLSNRAASGHVAGKEARIGPTPEMLRTYYRLLYITSGASADRLIGPLVNRSQNDVGILQDFLTSGATLASPRGLFIEGSNFVESVAATNSVAQNLFLSNYLGLTLRSGDYSSIAGPGPACIDLDVTATVAAPNGAKFAVGQLQYETQDVFNRNPAMPEVVAASFYKDMGANGPYVASVLKTAQFIRPWIALTDGWDIKRTFSQSCANQTGRVAYLWDVFNTVFSPICPVTGPPGSTTDADEPQAVRVNYARVIDNPVRGGEATVEFGLTGASRVKVQVYDLAGRKVHEMANGSFAPGMHRLSWNGRDASGARIRAGVYFVRAEFLDQRFQVTNKMMLVR